MSFLQEIDAFEGFDFKSHLDAVTVQDVENALSKTSLSWRDFLALLSGTARAHLEPMAQKARDLTIQYFGRTISLYAPLYISNFCTNACTYCGFNRHNPFERRKLSFDEIEEEARILAATGIRHVLMLTGEDPARTPLSYLCRAVEILSSRFASVALEIYPMGTREYAALREAGADSLTVYQEVYDRKIYQKVHPAGKKADYAFRLLTPERGAAAGLRAVNIGALFGLAPVRSEAFFTGLHARYLEKTFPDVEIAVSIPRMTKADGGSAPAEEMPDRFFVQFMLALRLYMPRAGINISTREPAPFRNRLIRLGVTKMSAGSRTEVGGYGRKKTNDTPQFELSDTRSVNAVVQMIEQNGYQPVFKDWEPL